MTECTVCLNCNVSGWEYQRDISGDDALSDERLISLFGEITHRGFIERMPFDLRFLSGRSPSNRQKRSGTNVLEFNEAMPEIEYPESLSALIPIGATQFDDFRECLLRLDSHGAISLAVTLTVDGLQMDRSNNDRILPIAGRQLMITSFAWTLSCRNERS